MSNLQLESTIPTINLSSGSAVPTVEINDPAGQGIKDLVEEAAARKAADEEILGLLGGKLNCTKGYDDEIDSYIPGSGFSAGSCLYYIVAPRAGWGSTSFMPYYLYAFKSETGMTTQIRISFDGVKYRQYATAIINGIPTRAWTDWVSYQKELTLDESPIANSTNPVTSGGVYNVIGDIDNALDEIIAIQNNLIGGV